MQTAKRTLVALGIMLAVPALWTGCGGGRGVLFTPEEGAGGQAPGAAPTLANARVALPANFRWTGGAVSIQVQAAGAQSVTATVKRDRTSVETTVTLSAGAAGQYSGTFTAPANVSNDSTYEGYTVTIIARDAAGNQATTTTTFEVPPAAAPQAPPGL